MTALTDLTIAGARAGLRKKDFTAVELTQAHIDAMQAARALNAFITETPEQALAQARASDACYAQGDAGDLEGIPLAIKDLMCTEGVRTTAASRILAEFVPSYDATVVARLKAEGAVSVGKTIWTNSRWDRPIPPVPSAMSVNPWRRHGRRSRPGARRLVRRLGGGGRGAAVHGRHRHRYGRLDPPAGRLLRHHRHEADLRPLLALGHRRLRLVAGPGGHVRPARSRTTPCC